MAKRMLVDATHTEETRVVVVNGNRLEELDFEIASRKQLKGNIYLAKVTRVEPSLQAAFVEYGGNRHGFLAFSEIHPDYYRIPVADREALLAQERAFDDRNDEFGDGDEEGGRGRRGRRARGRSDQDAARSETGEDAIPGDDAPEDGSPEDGAPEDGASEDDPAEDDDAEDASSAEDIGDRVEYRAADYHAQQRSEPYRAPGDEADASARGDDPVPVDELARAAEPAEVDTAAEIVEDAGFQPPMETVPAGETPVEDMGGSLGEEEADDAPRRRYRPLRSYKIQEVIKRRQILLIQVVKEERGNKGAALTTYLSLPGRYCVLMPNTGRGGGISRKITNPQDRKRLKEMLSDLDIPEGMAVILRTAGMERTKQEIKRDLEYLLRLWDSIRELTLMSTAPALIYEEANLIKRSIRDLYSNDLDDVLVEGEDGYRAAKDFMRMLMPSHTKKVQPYRDETIPLFFRYQVESQIDAIHSPVVQLKSGGYVVINQTEALVAIDVNSGRSTKERNIEETAFKTNLEAADEIARQLRLRDLAGLIVIDFIDMEDARNNASVEKRLKEAMRNDRARIQLGRISPFGLLELSRQRLRPSLIETNFEKCPHCTGTGMVRSLESAALFVLRAIEEEGIRKRSSEITIHVANAIALYILNQKRDALAEIERRYGFRVFLFGDDTLTPPEYRLERIKARLANEEAAPSINVDRIRAETDRVLERETVEEEEDQEADQDEVEAETAESTVESEAASAEERGDRRRRRRRRRRSGEGSGEGSGEEGTEQRADSRIGETVAEGIPDGAIAGDEAETETEDETGKDEEGGEQDEAGFDEQGNGQRRKRRRGKRGGRRRSRGRQDFETQDEADADFDQETGMEPYGGEPYGEAGPQPHEAPGPAPGPVSATLGHAADLDDIFGDLDLPGPVELNQPAPTVETAPASTEPAPLETEAPEPPAVESPPAVQADTGEPAEAAVPPSAAAEEPPAKPKRARAPRKKKTEAATEPAATETDIQKAPAKAKPARTRKKKAETVPAETTLAETVSAEEAPAKPKRVRAPRKKKAEAAAAEPVAEAVADTADQPAGTTEPVAEPVAEPTPEPATEAAPEPVASPVDQEASGSTEGGQSEQAPEAPPAANDTDDAGNPAVEIVNTPPSAPRRGWWRRG